MKHSYRFCAFADEAGTEMDDQIKALQENKIGLLEIRGVNGKNISTLTTAEVMEVKRQLDNSGIKLWSVGSPLGKINITDDFAPHMDLFNHMLETAQILEATCIRLFSFYIPKNEADRYRDTVLERLLCFYNASKSSGITLCHENETGIYGDIAARCLDIHKNIPWLKAVFDPANFILSGQDVAEAWEMLSEYTYYLHIKDALPSGKVVPAGEGAGCIKMLLDSFAGKGSGVLTLEPHLKVFAGFNDLQKGTRDMGEMIYPSQRAAFDAAMEALKKLI